MSIKKGCLVLITLDLCILMGLLFLHYKPVFRNESGSVVESSSVRGSIPNAENVSEAKGNSPVENDSYKGKIAITFDDGPYPEFTKQLLDGLKERNVKATFFVIGASAEKYPEVVERMSKEGHLIGNHTYNHVQLTAVGTDTFKEEIRSTSDILYEITGKYPEFIRPPFGAWSKSLESELGMIPVLWNVDPLDWKCSDAQTIVNKVVKNVEENDIILMHDCYESSVEAALEIIDELQKQGYQFVTVDEILFD